MRPLTWQEPFLQQGPHYCHIAGNSAGKLGKFYVFIYCMSQVFPAGSQSDCGNVGFTGIVAAIGAKVILADTGVNPACFIASAAA